MRVVIDGIIFERQKIGGITRMFREIIPRVCGLDTDLEFEICLAAQPIGNIPGGKMIRRRSVLPLDRLLRPSRMWWPIQPAVRELAFRMSGVGHDQSVWHSTYYTSMRNWPGPVVTTLHDFIHERYSDTMSGGMNDQAREIKRKSVLEADVVICVSEATRQDLYNRYPFNGTATVIPHGVNRGFRRLSAETQTDARVPDRPFLLYLGGRETSNPNYKYKNFNTLLKGYSRWEHRDDIDLLVIGKPWSSDERAYLEDLGVANSVSQKFAIDDRLLCALYNKAVSMVYPSFYEGFGIPIAEAMSCGCPVVASQIPTSVEVGGSVPFYFDPSDVESLTDALSTALQQGKLPARVEQAVGRASKFSWEESARKTLKVYRGVS